MGTMYNYNQGEQGMRTVCGNIVREKRDKNNVYKY